MALASAALSRSSRFSSNRRRRPVGDELEIVAETAVDQRDLGMTWSPLGITRAPGALIIKGRLVKDS